MSLAVALFTKKEIPTPGTPASLFPILVYRNPQPTILVSGQPAAQIIIGWICPKAKNSHSADLAARASLDPGSPRRGVVLLHYSMLETE